MRRAILLLVALAAPAVAQPAGVPPASGRPACVADARVYIAPMGQVFRRSGAVEPTAIWFGEADRDGDGRLSATEFAADADAFFTALDLDRDGEIDPQEVIAYETNVAPEIRLYQRGAPVGPDRRRKDKRAYDERELGAGRFAQLNIPEPVASADADFNRGVSRAEFARAAASRFALLAAGAPALTLAALKPTPAQAQAAVCAAKLAAQAKKGRR